MKFLLPISLFLTSFLVTLLVPQNSTPVSPNSTTPSTSQRALNPQSGSSSSPRQSFAKIARLRDPQARLQQLITLANSLPIDQLETWLTSTNLAPLDPSLRTLLLTIACDRWLDSAPADLIRWNSRTNMVNPHHYLAHWLTRDRDAATTYLREKPSGYLRQYTTPQTIKHLAKLDFSLAFDFAKEQLQLSNQLSWLTSNEILFTLAKRDPETFRSFAPTLPEHLQKQITPALISSQLESDFPAAISQLSDQADGLDQLIASGNMIGHDQFAATLVKNVRQLPEGWLQKILTDHSSRLRNTSEILPLLESTPAELGITTESFAKLMLDQWEHDFGPENRPRLLAILNNGSLPLTARKKLLNGQIPFWINGSPDQFSQQLTDPALREFSLQQSEQVAAHQNSINPDSNPTLSVRNNADWTPAQTHEALSKFKNASPSEQKKTLRQIEISSWGQPNRPFVSNVFSTIATLDSLTEPRQKKQDLNHISYFAREWALDSPAEAAAWVETLPPGDHQTWAAKNVARTWQLYSPTEADAWHQSFLESQPR